MQHLIAKIGKGLKRAKDLTWEEAKLAMSILIEGQATPEQVGAFLMAMRIKTETVPELGAFTVTARQYVSPIQVSSELLVVDLPSYGEKHETFHISVAAGILASACDVPILMHGYDYQNSPCSVARILSELGIPVDLSSNDIPEELIRHRFAYLDMAIYHPPVARFLELRREFGVQNLFHQVARMLNPARARSQVIGIGHPPYLDKISEALSMLRSQHALVVQGVEGCPELSIATDTPARELREPRIFPLTFRPKDAGLRPGSFQDMVAPQPTHDSTRPVKEASLIHTMLDNRTHSNERTWLLFNTALLLYAGRKASSLSAAIPVAQNALKAGAGARRLEEFFTARNVEETFSVHQAEIPA